jgi:hypothetical protein
MEVCVITRFACHSEELPWAFGPPKGTKITCIVTPAKAGVYGDSGTQWIPAFAGMT